MGFPGGSDIKESAWNSGEPGSMPSLGRSPGEGNGNPLQYSCLEKSMDRESPEIMWIPGSHMSWHKMLSYLKIEAYAKGTELKY